MLPNEHIKVRIEKAFSPLRCVAKIWDYKHRIKFMVFDAENNGILEVPELILENVRDEAQLTTVLLAARERVEKMGFVLDDWP